MGVVYVPVAVQEKLEPMLMATKSVNIMKAVGVTSSLVDRLALEMSQISCQTSLYSARLRRKRVEIC